MVEDSLVSPIVACVCGLGCGITSGVLCTEWHRSTLGGLKEM